MKISLNSLPPEPNNEMISKFGDQAPLNFTERNEQLSESINPVEVEESKEVYD